MKSELHRRLIAEALGTFAIVFFGCGAMITLGARPDVHLIVNIVFGLTVAASVYAVGHISGAHLNPAVTFGFAATGRFPWSLVAKYVGAQCAGAILASGFHAFLMGAGARQYAYGITSPAVDLPRAIVAEILLTFFLMFVIASVATDRRVDGAIPGLAVGMTVSLCGLFGGPITGCSMNPARSLGPALFARSSGLSVLWIYWVGPIIGAVLAAKLYEAIRGEGRHGKGVPNDIELTLETASVSS